MHCKILLRFEFRTGGLLYFGALAVFEKLIGITSSLIDSVPCEGETSSSCSWVWTWGIVTRLLVAKIICNSFMNHRATLLEIFKQNFSFWLKTVVPHRLLSVS